jgi:tripartite-type tricarboxylate transporter receptor subunit TctC
LAVGAAALPAVSRNADAQSYPTPITMIVSAAAGSFADVTGRIIAERMREKLGRPIIIENIGGADGSIGAGRAARAKPDGYTIDIGALSNHVLNGAFYSLNYDPLNDFAPTSPLATNSFFSLCEKDSAGDGPDRADCLVEVQSEGVGWNHLARAAPGRRCLSEGNRNASSGRPLVRCKLHSK